MADPLMELLEGGMEETAGRSGRTSSSSPGAGFIGSSPSGGFLGGAANAIWGPSVNQREDIYRRDKQNSAAGADMAQRQAMDYLMNKASALLEENPGVQQKDLFKMILADPQGRKSLMDFPAGSHIEVLSKIKEALNPNPAIGKFGASMQGYNPETMEPVGKMFTSPSDAVQKMDWIKANYNDPVGRILIDQMASGEKTQVERATMELYKRGWIDEQRMYELRSGQDQFLKDNTGALYYKDKTGIMQKVDFGYPPYDGVGAAPGQPGQPRVPGVRPQGQAPGQPPNQIGQVPSPTSPAWTPSGEAGTVQPQRQAQAGPQGQPAPLPPQEEFSETVRHLKTLERDPTLMADVAGAKGTITGAMGTLFGIADPRYSQPLINASRQKMDQARKAILDVAGARPLKAEYEDIARTAPDSQRIFDNPMNLATTMWTGAKKMEDLIRRADQEPSRRGATTDSIKDWGDIRRQAENALRQMGSSAQWEAKIGSIEKGGSQLPMGQVPGSVGDLTNPLGKNIDELRKQQPGASDAVKPTPGKSEERAPGQKVPEDYTKYKSQADFEAAAQKRLESPDVSIEDVRAIRAESERRKKLLKEYTPDTLSPEDKAPAKPRGAR